jgi:hypothetical protein
MATNWPGSRDTFTNPTSGDTLDSPSHAAQHANINDAVEAMQGHAGLVLVKPTSVTGGTIGTYGAVTIGNAVSSVTVLDAFSSAFDNYRIVGHVNSCSSTVTGDLQLGIGSTMTTTGYYWSHVSVNSSGTVGGTAATNDSKFAEISVMAPNGASFVFDVVSPNLARRTGVTSQGSDMRITGSFLRYTGGFAENTTQFTSFTLLPRTGTITGGTIRVYGYNNG